MTERTAGRTYEEVFSRCSRRSATVFRGRHRALTSDEILHQGIDQSLEAFNRELASFSEGMRQYQARGGHSPETPE